MTTTTTAPTPAASKPKAPTDFTFIDRIDPKNRVALFCVLLVAFIGAITAGFIIFLMVAYNFNILQWIE